MLRRKTLIAMPHAFFGSATTYRSHAALANDDSALISEHIVTGRRSKFTFNNGETIILSQEFADSGSFADIYQVFESEASTQPVSCLKFAREQEEKTDLCHEQSMLTMMGRSARLFRIDGLLALLTDWQPGYPLYRLLKSDVQRLSLPERLRCVYSLLLQLKQLHDLGYCHRDLHSANIIADLTRFTMSMIDFGEADEMTNSMVARRDIMCVGKHVELFLFPDICGVEPVAAKHHLLAKGIKEMVKKMLHQSGQYYSVDMAAADCKSLLEAACQIEHEAQDRNFAVRKFT